MNERGRPAWGGIDDGAGGVEFDTSREWTAFAGSGDPCFDIPEQQCYAELVVRLDHAFRYLPRQRPWHDPPMGGVPVTWPDPPGNSIKLRDEGCINRPRF